MNRIYLKQRKNGAYWIKDLLDNKEIGKVKINNDLLQLQLKSKYQGKFIKEEVISLLQSQNNASFRKTYQQYLNTLLDDKFNLIDYNYPLFAEACRLQPCKNDIFNRPTLLHPAAKKAWLKMQQNACQDNIELQIISAFRSLTYQKQLIDNKLANGNSIAQILKVNTLPGYSEHHTGCAIDIGCAGAAILEQDFENSPAFKWLVKNARKFNFIMSYPKGNTTGICYEPWHWCYQSFLNEHLA
ncbi:MAG: D-alanyl-D-alanine carboxypeptidase family protein [Proteobacteria bacterium]|nr:D-alanyl-D-alanine carboxypeptidase family protein [Pseudomonadota bacterium]